MVRGALAVLLAATLSGCWLQPGFDAGRTNSNAGETVLTSGTVAGMSLLWDTTLPDTTGVNAPLSRGGTVFVTATRTAATDGARVFGLDAASGTIHWGTSITVPEWGAPTEIYAPALQVDHLLVPWWRDGVNGGPGGLASVTLDGTVTNLPVGNATDDVALAGTTPAARRWTRGGSSGFSWTWIDWTYRPLVPFPLIGSPGSSFAIVGERVAWSAGSRALGFSAACPPYSPPQQFSGCASDWSIDLGGVPAPAAAVGAGQVVYGDDSGTVTVLDMATGAVVWTAEVGAPITQRAAVDGDKIVVATADGRIVVLPANGCGDAVCTPLWEGSTGAAATAAPLVGGDVVYATAGAQIVAFALDGCGAATCPEITTVTAPDAITGGPIVHDGRLLAGTANGHLVAFGLAVRNEAN